MLLKDLGCSSNSSKVCYLFGASDQDAKANLKLTDWTSVAKSVGYIASNVAPEGNLLQKASRFLAVATGGRKVRELVQTRCDRGATIARSLQLPEATAAAIHSLDEHWDGSGYPDGLSGDHIPILARILGLAQTAEVFWKKGGVDAACQVAVDRSGTWFDPELVKLFLSLRNDNALWSAMTQDNAADQAVMLEPQGLTLSADEPHSIASPRGSAASSTRNRRGPSAIPAA